MAMCWQWAGYEPRFLQAGLSLLPQAHGSEEPTQLMEGVDLWGLALQETFWEIDGPGQGLLPWRPLIPLTPSLICLVWKLMQVLEPSSANMKPSLSSLSKLGD